jgi:hypothetical protein
MGMNGDMCFEGSVVGSLKASVALLLFPAFDMLALHTVMKCVHPESLRWTLAFVLAGTESVRTCGNVRTTSPFQRTEQHLFIRNRGLTLLAALFAVQYDIMIR